jgi:hypothetical protein
MSKASEVFFRLLKPIIHGFFGNIQAISQTPGASHAPLLLAQEISEIDAVKHARTSAPA